MRGENLPNTKRTPAQREHDREEVARLLARGFSLRAIRDALNGSRGYHLSLTQIGKDAVRVRRNLRAALERQQDDFMAEILAVIRLVEREAWESWEASQADRKRTHKIKRGRKILQTTIIAETSHGDPRFLALVLGCIETRFKLFGCGAQPGRDIGKPCAEMIFAGPDNARA